ncbi:DNA repair protein RecO, partial [Enterobacter hormaechei]
PWSETSLMLDVFTEESGRVGRFCTSPRFTSSNKKSPFNPLNPHVVRLCGRGELKNKPTTENDYLARPLFFINL